MNSLAGQFILPDDRSPCAASIKWQPETGDGLADRLIESPHTDWVSITDNAGGNPQLAPTALGKAILYAGKNVVIHLTCKDLNRNELESEAWLLHPRDHFCQQS